MIKNINNPPMVRILPMSKKYEFPDWSINKVQYEFFFDELYNRVKWKKHGYLYKSSGLKAPEGSMVLFQYDKHIIATARLTKIEKFDVPKDGEYNGAFYFEPSSITIFDPITNDEISSIWLDFSGFSQTKHKLSPEKYSEFEKLVKTKNPKHKE
ncbi:hypothetical protein [Desulfobacula sp.]